MSDFWSDFFRVFFITFGINRLLLSIYDLRLSAKADGPQQKKYQRGRGVCRLLIGIGTVVIILTEFLYRPFQGWRIPLAYGLLYPLPVFAVLYLRKKYSIRRKK